MFAKIGASASAVHGERSAEIVGGCLTKSDCKVKINVLADLSACGGAFFMHIYN